MKRRKKYVTKERIGKLRKTGWDIRQNRTDKLLYAAKWPNIKILGYLKEG